MDCWRKAVSSVNITSNDEQLTFGISVVAFLTNFFSFFHPLKKASDLLESNKTSKRWVDNRISAKLSTLAIATNTVRLSIRSNECHAAFRMHGGFSYEHLFGSSIHSIRCGRTFTSPAALSQHCHHCPHYQEQFRQCQQFLRGDSRTIFHESMQEPLVKHLKTTSLDSSKPVVPFHHHQALPSPSTASSLCNPQVLPVIPVTCHPNLHFRQSLTHWMCFHHEGGACLLDIETTFQSHLAPSIQFQPLPPFYPKLFSTSSTLSCTSFNKFGIAWEYRHWPSYDPEHAVPAHELSSSTDNDGVTTCSDTQKRPPPFPWPNMSIWRLMAWQLTGNGEKSSVETTRLVH
ncbi:hypothetical protein EV401DRAFT_1892712 [Pisolithus croceorrhizus]|nr:hypothetical protein EV401DRAFT_1892712 [Pisolithus croceorrhizus]